MITRTGQYALRAAVYLAQHSDEWPVPGRQVAESTGIPPKYLSKILGDLVRAGLLDATRGKGGGFRMTRSPDMTTLIEVLTPFEPFLSHQRPCPFRHAECNDYDPCPGHERWRAVRECYQEFLRTTSILDVAFSAPLELEAGIHKGMQL